jgi:hypothetical protein
VPSVATAPHGRGLISPRDRLEVGFPHFTFIHAHAPPSLCYAALNRRGSVGASRLYPPPRPDAASLSSAFTPWCSSTSPLAPSTPSPCSHHQFPSIVVPPRAHRQLAAPASPASPTPHWCSTTPNNHRRREPSSGEPPPHLTP